MRKSPFEKHLDRQRKGIANLMRDFAVASKPKKGAKK